MAAVRSHPRPQGASKGWGSGLHHHIKHLSCRFCSCFSPPRTHTHTHARSLPLSLKTRLKCLYVNFYIQSSHCIKCALKLNICLEETRKCCWGSFKSLFMSLAGPLPSVVPAIFMTQVGLPFWSLFWMSHMRINVSSFSQSVGTNVHVSLGLCICSALPVPWARPPSQRFFGSNAPEHSPQGCEPEFFRST